MNDSVQNTPLHEWHRKRGGRLTDFAGWRLPVFYEGAGIVAEHLHTRAAASLFDVSHMAQVSAPAAVLEKLSPPRFSELAAGECKYALLLNDDGGIVDDFVAGKENSGDGCRCVFNASRRESVLQRLRTAAAENELREHKNLALLAVQGPLAEAAVCALLPLARELDFMRAMQTEWLGEECVLCRCGYTGEDGFEISIAATVAEELANALIAGGVVQPAGLGARDSLRLEAGLCLYGNELNEKTTPAEAGLLWTIPKTRLQNESENETFAGANVLREQIQSGVNRALAGFLPQTKIPVRGGAQLIEGNETVGEITSGLFAPTLNAPAALGYIKPEKNKTGATVDAIVRGKRIQCKIAPPPFVPRRYKKKEKGKQ